MKLRRPLLLISALVFWLGYSAKGDTIAFDFDALTLRQPTPFDLTSGGVTAHFSSPTDPASFSVQNYGTTFYALSQFSGNFLSDNDASRNFLNISFSQQLISIVLTFATIDYHDPGPGGTFSDIQLTAYMKDSTGMRAVGLPVTAHGSRPPLDTFPQGTLWFDFSGQPFNLVEIVVPFQPGGATDFLLDNITATTAPAAVPEPNSAGVVGFALVSLAAVVRRQRRLQ